MKDMLDPTHGSVELVAFTDIAYVKVYAWIRQPRPQRVLFILISGKYPDLIIASIEEVA